MEYVEILKTELVNKIKRNPQYSQRAFARHLELSPGELSEILNLKRPLTLKKGVKIVEKLGYSHIEKERFLNSIQGKEGPKEIEIKSISLDIFALLSDFVPFAILNLSDCKNFHWNTSWIAEKLGVHNYEVELAIERLLRVGLLKKVNGTLNACPEYVISPTDIPSRAIRNYHAVMLNKAIASLEEQSVEERDISGVGFSINKDKVPLIKKEISEFLDQIVKKYSQKGSTSVYQLETALFELTKEATNE